MQDREAAYVELTKLYAAGTAVDRQAIIDGWDFGAEWKRPDLRRLVCSAREHYSSAERIEAALLYRAIASGKRLIAEPNTEGSTYAFAKAGGKEIVDYRDELVVLAVIYQSAIAAGLDGNALFNKVVAMSPQPVAQFIRAFAARPEGLKSLSAFLLARVVNADGEIELHQRGF